MLLDQVKRLIVIYYTLYATFLFAIFCASSYGVYLKQQESSRIRSICAIDAEYARLLHSSCDEAEKSLREVILFQGALSVASTISFCGFFSCDEATKSILNSPSVMVFMVSLAFIICFYVFSIFQKREESSWHPPKYFERERSAVVKLISDYNNPNVVYRPILPRPDNTLEYH